MRDDVWFCHKPGTDPRHSEITAIWGDDIHARMWRRISQRDPDECWPWTGETCGGYGRAKRRIGPRCENRTLSTKAHRLVYELEIGRLLPLDVFVRHLCNNPICCNPAHLTHGSHQDNMTDMVVSGRSTRGENNPNAKLKAYQVDEIRSMRSRGMKLVDIANAYGVHTATVGYICQDHIWTDTVSAARELRQKTTP